ncbi:DUF5753 domain-containing protein [Streptomyces sp. NPDC003077]|uniref:DUF5753 domain-containing protein n=1 Tax=Streptomyces sp. NPDC003077 TaxID=3154443 RepID=UPI0033AAAECC
MDLEPRARLIAEYAGQVVPGLVQTEDYARALFRAHDPLAPPEVIEEKVALRMERQVILGADPPPQLDLILDEAVLRRPIGGPRGMCEQLERLVALVENPACVVQVIPFAHGEHAFLGGALTLLTLDDGTCVAYEESIDTGQLIEENKEVASRYRAYDRMRAAALSPRQSALFIKQIMEGIAT